ncbi:MULTISPECIES: hypothetical protein [Dactylosporangium]|uniref:Uncharacterized protein n=2 Tax=Dactylosporangium TaxID=35753 RepID=A0A9W6KS24_9ACTN|nr:MULTISPECIES: hypothetical protein [Dactylosporangium]UAB98202.1 hypothetical protein Dvina_08995 [Dactylosporangium vinaceum]UWZ46451.1 hypothetical protein Dmats_08515 [Dactylosporangium matsuzakiense]GLL06578.1 hypothetical protein GCM10017581_083280 [Dactylosporangium matsuzakiense]
MNRMTRTALAAAVAVAAALTLAAPAQAAPTLDSAKQAVDARIDKRLAALKQYDSTIADAKQLTAAHKDTLTKLVADQRAGLTALKTKVDGETTAAALRTDAQSMVNDYRVFLLTGPKVRLTAAIDTELAVAAKMADKQPGADAVKQALTGQADKLLAVRPGADADAIKSAVTPIRDAAKKAHTDLKALRKSKK